MMRTSESGTVLANGIHQNKVPNNLLVNEHRCRPSDRWQVRQVRCIWSTCDSVTLPGYHGRKNAFIPPASRCRWGGCTSSSAIAVSSSSGRFLQRPRAIFGFTTSRAFAGWDWTPEDWANRGGAHRIHRGDCTHPPGFEMRRNEVMVADLRHACQNAKSDDFDAAPGSRRQAERIGLTWMTAAKRSRAPANRVSDLSSVMA